MQQQSAAAAVNSSSNSTTMDPNSHARHMLIATDQQNMLKPHGTPQLSSARTLWYLKTLAGLMTGKLQLQGVQRRQQQQLPSQLQQNSATSATASSSWADNRSLLGPTEPHARALLGEASQVDLLLTCHEFWDPCPDGMIPLWPSHVVHQVELLIFVLGVTHIFYTGATMFICLWQVGHNHPLQHTMISLAGVLLGMGECEQTIVE